MTSIHHQVGIRATLEKTYQAISTLERLSQWWSKATGDTRIDGVIVFHFGDVTVDMKVDTLLENKQVKWQCVVEDGQWKNTYIAFSLEYDNKNNQTLVNFTHSHWQECTPLFSHCSTKWAVFLLSLKDYLEKGKGRPYPDDIHIDYYE